VAVLSNSGGPATSTADHIGKSDLELAKFSPQQLDSLQKLMPHTGSCQNPIDLTFSSDLSIFSEKLPRLLSQSHENDAILLYGLFGADLFNRVVERAKKRDPKRPDWKTPQMEESVAEAMANSLKNCPKPVLGSSFNIRGDQSIRRLMRKGNIPFYNGPEQAVQALEAMWRYSRIRECLSQRKMEV